MAQRKDYLTYENQRNHAHQNLYKDILHEVFGTDEAVVIAHHLTFDGDKENPDEIPAADTMIFDHVIARAIWGSDYIAALQQLAAVPCEERDGVLAQLYYNRASKAAA